MVDKMTFEPQKKQVEDTVKRSAIDEKSVIQEVDKILNDAPDNYLVAGKGQDGAYILTPRTGNFAEISNLVKNIFGEKSVDIKNNQAPITETASIFITNGTWISGLAGRISENLKSETYKITGTGNAIGRGYLRPGHLAGNPGDDLGFGEADGQNTGQFQRLPRFHR